MTECQGTLEEVSKFRVIEAKLHVGGRVGVRIWGKIMRPEQLAALISHEGHVEDVRIPFKGNSKLGKGFR